MISGSLTAVEIAAGVRSGSLSALAVAEAAIGRANAANPRINAFTTLTPERALAEARAVDRSVAEGRDPGPLAGAPYAVKNLFDLAGVVTLAGSKINRDDPAAPADATIVGRLKQAGAVCLGAVNMGEYAYDFTTENTHYGATRNPRDLTRSAGGSSGRTQRGSVRQSRTVTASGTSASAASTSPTARPRRSNAISLPTPGRTPGSHRQRVAGPAGVSITVRPSAAGTGSGTWKGRELCRSRLSIRCSALTSATVRNPVTRST